MIVQPPSLPDARFDEIDTPLEDRVERHFQPWVARELHPFLNSLPCLADVQSLRRRWRTRTVSAEPFGTFKAEPQHWYSFNHGGRNEAQFNVGMFPGYLRIGMGFEFTEKRGGNPTEVTFAYTAFRHLTQGSTAYAEFVSQHQIEVEFDPGPNGTIGYAATQRVVSWEPPPSPPIRWIFFGRLLRRGTDRDVLEDPDQLGEVLEAVLCGFKPFWVKAQELAVKWNRT